MAYAVAPKPETRTKKKKVPARNPEAEQAYQDYMDYMTGDIDE